MSQELTDEGSNPSLTTMNCPRCNNTLIHKFGLGFYGCDSWCETAELTSKCSECPFEHYVCTFSCWLDEYDEDNIPEEVQNELLDRMRKELNDQSH